MDVVAREPRANAAFLRLPRSGNHHDLGLFGVGAAGGPKRRGAIGLYHLAWQLDTIDELTTARQALLDADAYTGESSHGATKSVYGADPDGNEFELMWMLPRERVGPVRALGADRPSRPRRRGPSLEWSSHRREHRHRRRGGPALTACGHDRPLRTSHSGADLIIIAVGLVVALAFSTLIKSFTDSIDTGPIGRRGRLSLNGQDCVWSTRRATSMSDGSSPRALLCRVHGRI